MELHLSLAKRILGKPILADMSIDAEGFDELPSSREQADYLLQCYRDCQSALRNKEVSMTCKAIKKIK